MSGRRVDFFATGNDAVALLAQAGGSEPLQLVRSGLLDSAEPEILPFPDAEDLALEFRMLVMARGELVTVRAVPQLRGGVKYAVDLLENPRAVSLSLGGRDGDRGLVKSLMGTTSENPTAVRVFTLLKEAMRDWERVKGWRLGPEASRLLDQGWRLMAGQRSPPLYDLRRG